MTSATIIDVTKTHNDSPKIVTDSLQKLVTHYSQSVHKVDEDEPPYFDPIHGHPLQQVPSVVQFLLNSLTTEIPHNHLSIFECINGYVKFIRPCIIGKSSQSFSVSVLPHYEILISQWIQHVVIEQDSPPSSTLLTDTETTKQLFYTMEVISSDITLFTSSSTTKSFDSKYKRCNIVLPCLLRVLSHIFHLLKYFGLTFDQGDNRIQCSSIIRCFVSLLAFDNTTLDPRKVSKSLISNFHVGYTNRFCACPPSCGDDDEKEGGPIDKSFSLEEESSPDHTIDWKSVCIEDFEWMDKATWVTSRAANEVWSALKSCFGPDQFSLVDQLNNKSMANDRDATIRSIMKYLNRQQLAKAVKDHFFGQDLKLWENETKVSTQVIMGRRISKTETIIKDKSFKVIPSRINVAIDFISRLTKGDNSIETTRDLLVELMPIVFELVDAANAAHIALGVSSFIQILDVLQPTSQSLQGFAEPAWSALELNFTSRREEAVLLLIGQAQLKLLPLLQDINSRRRKLTKRWLLLLDQSVGRPNKINLCYALLIGGIIPLLFEHTQQPNADAMELSRLGLRAILPMLESEFYDTDAKIAALVALVNLMIGGYPAMPDHGGKIICSILAATLSLKISSSGNDNDEIAKRRLCIHTGAVALNICGEKHAGVILDDLASNRKETYQQNLFTAIHDIRRNSKELTECNV